MEKTKTKSKTMKLKSTIDYKPTPHKPKGQSMTVPNDTLSIREILLRSVNGLPPMGRDGNWSNEDDFDQEDLEALGRASITEQFIVGELIQERKREAEEKLDIIKAEKDRLRKEKEEEQRKEIEEFRNYKAQMMKEEKEKKGPKQ